MIPPGLRNIEAAKQIDERLDDWNWANEVVSSYFEANLENANRHAVLTKVVLLNGLYSTNLKDPLGMARHILELHGLDEQLGAGEVEAVERIATVDSRHFISFASKYAHFHNKTAFPMYDRFVAAALSKQLRTPESRYREYRVFFETIKVFRQQAGLASVCWEDFDKYLWLYGQKKALDKGERAIGRQVKTLYLDPEGHRLFEALEP